jgi:DNA-binding response OmpR family regulator
MAKALRILVVEDERDLVESIAEFLNARGHVVDIALDGKTGLHLALTNNYDAMVLDLGLPRLGGLGVCKALRDSTRSNLSVLMLTARDSLDDKLAGFDHGTDDYLVKPFALPELERRLTALARRSALNQGHVLAVGELRYDLSEEKVTRADLLIDLNPACRRLLTSLMRSSPHIVNRDDLEFAIWGDSPPSGEGLKAHIHLLRQALGRSACGHPFENSMIETVQRRGYRIVP